MVRAAIASLLALAAPALAAPIVVDARGKQVAVADASRIVAVGGSVTEIVHALGAGAKIVGVDTSSTYPPSVSTLPKVGYQRTLSAEGILSLRPSLVLATTDAGPPAALAQLEAAGVTTLILPGDPTVAEACARIRAVGRALGLEERAAELARTLEAEVAEASERSRSAGGPRVLFLYARGHSTLLVSGVDTAADEMIRLAGGVNAASAYSGFKPLTPEAAVAASPDVLLVTDGGLASLGGVDGLLTLPGLILTPAGKARRVVAMDDLYLLGFGPRTGRAVADLAASLRAPASASAGVVGGGGG